MNRLPDALRALGREDQILLGEPMSRHTTFRVGGPADVLFLPESAGQVAGALSAARDAGVDAFVIGNGSNLLVRDGGVRVNRRRHSDGARRQARSRPFARGRSGNRVGRIERRRLHDGTGRRGFYGRSRRRNSGAIGTVKRINGR